MYNEIPDWKVKVVKTRYCFLFEDKKTPYIKKKKGNKILKHLAIGFFTGFSIIFFI